MKFNFNQLSDIPAIICDKTKRHDCLVFWDATACNPNGDPDAANAPRRDDETGLLYATDSSVKRRLRDFLELLVISEKLENCGIFVRRDTFLSDTIMQAYRDCGIDFTPKKGAKDKADKKMSVEGKEKANQHICQKYFDVRMLGGVLVAGGGHNAGKVTGPCQFGFSYSIDPVEAESIAITRVCGDQNENGDDSENGKVSQTQTMGRKEFVHYALLKTPVYYNPNIRSEFVSDSDLRLFWFSLLKMWDVSKTSSKNLALQKMVVFTHDNPFGNAPTHELFNLIKVQAKVKYPRSINDYDITFNPDDVPEGVTVTVLY